MNFNNFKQLNECNYIKLIETYYYMICLYISEQKRIDSTLNDFEFLAIWKTEEKKFHKNVRTKCA